MQALPTFVDMLKHFRTHGSRRMEIVEQWKPEDLPDLIDFHDFSVISIDSFLLPLLAAHCAGLTVFQLTQVARASGIKVVQLVDGIIIKEFGEMIIDQDSVMPLQPFLQVSLEAALMADPGFKVGSQLTLGMARVLRGAMRQSSEWALAIILLGLPGVGYDVMAKQAAYDLTKLQAPDEHLESALCLAATPESLIVYFQEDIDYKGAWLGNFIQGAGVLAPSNLRNVTGLSSFWTQIVLELSLNEVCQPLFEHPLLDSPETMQAILRSLDTELMLHNGHDLDNLCDFDSMGNSIDCLISCLESRGMGHLLDPLDIRLLIAKMALSVSEAMSKAEPENDTGLREELRRKGRPADIFLGVFDVRTNARNRVAAMAIEGAVEPGLLMEAQLLIPADMMSMPQFLLWNFLKGINLLRGDVEPGLANRHLSHMADSALSLKLDNYQMVGKLRNNYALLDNSMRELSKFIDPLIDYAAFKKQSLARREMLALWGLDHQKLGIKEGKSLDWRISRDLGL